MSVRVCLFCKMAGRRPALQWRQLARHVQNCLRGRAARYVAAAALCLVAACGCCLATLLPLTTLLGVLAAVLLPSFLRFVQLRHVRGLLRQEVLLLELCGNRKPCGHCSALALCKTGMVAQLDSITYTSGARMLCGYHLCKLSFLSF